MCTEKNKEVSYLGFEENAGIVFFRKTIINHLLMLFQVKNPFPILLGVIIVKRFCLFNNKNFATKIGFVKYLRSELKN